MTVIRRPRSSPGAEPQEWRGGLVTVALSLLFLGVAIALLLVGGAWLIVAFPLGSWGAMGLASGLRNLMVAGRH
jgi:hypothetical protein